MAHWHPAHVVEFFFPLFVLLSLGHKFDLVPSPGGDKQPTIGHHVLLFITLRQEIGILLLPVFVKLFIVSKAFGIWFSEVGYILCDLEAGILSHDLRFFQVD